MKYSALVFVLVLVSGCGGKILEERASGQEPPSSPDPSTSSQGATPTLPPKNVEDPCDTICTRNNACGAWQPDCNQHCADDLRASSACRVEATAYVQCYAANLEGCAALPPVCEPAYCAYARCAGKVVPSYCP